MKKIFQLLGLILLFAAGYVVAVSFSNEVKVLVGKDKIKQYYQKHKGDTVPSISIGTVSNGSILHAKLLPFSGANYQYFDRWSYLNGRAFLNGYVLNTVLNSYAHLNGKLPNRTFKVMECAHKKGGKLFPHRTHQNGLSVDFMMPLQKEGKPYYGLDDKGVKHYLLQFDDAGRYEKDKSISIDFDLVAQHIIELNKQAIKQGFKIKKVIIKIELKDDLFKTKHGKLLKKSGIYLVQGLTPKINDLHDDHYHIDFEEK